MQSFDLCGLRVTCAPNEHSQYMELKTSLEEYLKNIQQKLRQLDFSRVVLHSVLLESGLRFSVYVKNRQIYFGFYDKQTTQIYQKCSYWEIKALSEQLNTLEIRIINQLHTQKSLPVSLKMQQAWENCLQEQELMNEEIDNSYER